MLCSLPCLCYLQISSACKHTAAIPSVGWGSAYCTAVCHCLQISCTSGTCTRDSEWYWQCRPVTIPDSTQPGTTNSAGTSTSSTATTTPIATFLEQEPTQGRDTTGAGTQTKRLWAQCGGESGCGGDTPCTDAAWDTVSAGFCERGVP